MISSVTGEDSLLYDSHGKRDPFVPLITMTSKESVGLIGVESIEEINIEGIVYDRQKGSIVIVNGEVLREGEQLGNIKVVKIQPDGAVFSLNGNEAFKTMYQEQDKENTIAS